MDELIVVAVTRCTVLVVVTDSPYACLISYGRKIYNPCLAEKNLVSFVDESTPIRDVQ